TAATAVEPAGAAFGGAIENVLDVIRLAALLPLVHQPVHLVIGNEGAMDTHRQTGARRHAEHVAGAEPLVGTALIEDGARVAAADWCPTACRACPRGRAAVRHRPDRGWCASRCDWKPGRHSVWECWP